MRVLILKFGDPIMDMIGSALPTLGHEAKILNVNQLRAAEILKICREYQPDFYLTNNTYVIDVHPDAVELESFLKTKPLLIWQTEAPGSSGSIEFFDRYAKGDLPQSAIWLLSDSHFVDDMKGRGFQAFHLPLGVDPALQTHQPKISGQTFKFPMVYIGSPITPESNEPVSSSQIYFRFVDAIREDIVNRLFELDISKSETTRNKLLQLDQKISEYFVRFFKTFQKNSQTYRTALEKFIEELQRTELESHWSKVKAFLLGRIHWLYSHQFQILALNKLIDKGLRVYGGSDWKVWLPTYSHSTPRLSEAELLQAYREAEMVFCMTKFQFRNFMHDRPMAVLAAGGFPLTDARADLEAMFERDEIARYQDLDEARDLIDYYAKNSSERARISAKGRTRVFAEHTYRHRAEKLVKIAQENF